MINAMPRAICVSLALLSVPAAAHDFWIEPGDLRPEVGDKVEIQLREGVDFKGNTLPYIPQWFVDFSESDAGGRRPIESLIGDDPAAVIRAKSGALLLGYRSNRNFVNLDADKFNSYLEEEGIEFIREARIERGEDDAPAPEYFVRCAKALLQTGPAEEAVYATELGYILELIPESDPYTMSVGDELGFRLVYRDKPAAQLLVQAFTSDNPTNRQRLRTDDQGKVRIKIDRPGIWMIKAVNIQPIIGDPKALWQSYWASFVFQIEYPPEGG